MDDLISRQAAISEIAKWMLEYGGENEKRERDALGNAANGIKKLPSAQTEQRWIPVTERLPEKYAEVLVSVNYKYKGEPKESYTDVVSLTITAGYLFGMFITLFTNSMKLPHGCLCRMPLRKANDGGKNITSDGNLIAI